MSAKRETLKAQIERLRAGLAQAQWDLAHYQDMHRLACGMTVAQLTPISAVLALEKEDAQKAATGLQSGSPADTGK